MFGRLLLLFTLIPIAELILLIWLGARIGFWPTVGLIVITAVVGAYLARREGTHAWNRFQRRLSTGQLPGRELTDGLIVLVSGALLLTPGMLTDVAGLLGLFPPSRAAFRGYLTRAMQRGISRGTIHVSTFGGFGPPQPPPAAGGGGPQPGGPRGDEGIQDVDFEEFERRDSGPAPRY